ncbi:hypothetical protein BZA70DRAFT_312241 [Myxozyma melibiosi]|uniref:Glycosyl transferase family 25 domain-containing protein n=1 Tax=Myxozyma melibiosi TaxID=54550 RepID=A0ABR1F174_9ASCO
MTTTFPPKQLIYAGRRPFILLAASVSVTVAIFFIIVSAISLDPFPLPLRPLIKTSTTGADTDSKMPHTFALATAAQNESLGFGEIVYISMPYRTDRQDAMNLVASTTGIKLKLIPGVDGSTIHEKAKPDFLPENLTPSALGCWRAHADAWRYMLDSNLESLLILEDDVDWDINIHEIMEHLSLEMQNNPLRLDPQTEREREAAPYGLDWDFLFLGHCLDSANPDRNDLFHMYKDNNMPERESQIHEMKDMERRFGLSEQQISEYRTLSPTWFPACTMSYAITRRGAQRLLMWLSYMGLNAPVDNDIAFKAQSGHLHGYDLNPPPFGAWRVQGSKDSDNQEFEEGKPLAGEGNRGGFSLNVRNSARKRLASLLYADTWNRYEKMFPKKSDEEVAAAKSEGKMGYR